MKRFKFAALSAMLLISALIATGADKRVSELTPLVQGDWAAGDTFNIIDVSASASKKTTVADFDLRFFKLSDVLTVPRGGTGLASGTSGGVLGYTATGTIASSGTLVASQLVLGGGLGALPTSLAAGAQYQVLRMGALVPAYGSIALDQSAAVTGILPNANTTATSTNTVSAIVARDGSGNFSAGTINAALTGNASTATALASNPSDCASDTYANAIAESGNLTCGAITNAATTATSANTASAIVARDGSGNFTAGTITAAIAGNASTATALAANPADCGSNTFAQSIAASGALTCAAVNLGTSDTTGVTTIAKGGTNKALTLSAGGIPYTDSDSFEILSAGSSGYILTSGGASAPSWMTHTQSTYTPTITNSTNVAASGAVSSLYIRFGSTVIVYGRMTIDPTIAASATEVGISLPVASNLASDSDLSGTCNNGGAGSACFIQGDVANDRAFLREVPTSASNEVVVFTFMYQIL